MSNFEAPLGTMPAALAATPAETLPQPDQISRTRRVFRALGDIAWQLHPMALTERVESLTLRVISKRQVIEQDIESRRTQS